MNIEQLKSAMQEKRSAYAAAEDTRTSNVLLSELQELEADYRKLQAEVRNDLNASADGETREQNTIGSEVRMAEYIKSAVEQKPVSGREAEYNASLNLPDNGFPLRVLAPPQSRTEQRATTDEEAQVSQNMWLDRLFADTAASAVGITMRAVPAGVSAYPVTTSGPAPAMRARTQEIADGTFDLDVVEMRPKRAGVSLRITEEDKRRLPMLEDSLRRDLMASMTEYVDRICFTGDATASGTDADIVGLQTAAITESTLSQTAKTTIAGWQGLLWGYVDGVSAATASDIRIVASVGTNVLLQSTVANSSAENETLSQHLMRSGFMWATRGGIETATTAGKFGAYIGLGRGIEGAAISAVWESGQLIIDPYSRARTGEVQITLSMLHDFKVVRAGNFRRVKYT